MFEALYRKARRVIFSHATRRVSTAALHRDRTLAAGILREDARWPSGFPERNSVEPRIRTEIEGQITQRERISTAVEVPLTEECRKVLNLAGEEADRLGHRHVGTEHVLVALIEWKARSLLNSCGKGASSRKPSESNWQRHPALLA